MALTLLAFAILAGQASAAPGIQTWTGNADGSTPDIERNGLTLLDTNAAPLPGAIAGTINFTLNSAAYVGYCTDTTRQLSTSPEPVDAVVQDPPATEEARALTWILLNRTPTGTPTPEKQQLAATAQVAAWLLVDGQISQTAPTRDAVLNAAALALVKEARAATASPTSLSISTVAPAAGSTSSTVTVFGRSGAVVTLSVTSGGGSLSATQVVIGPAGFGTATLTASGPGAVTIAASTAGDGRLISINPTDQETQPQPTAAATPTTIDATAQVVFQAAPVTPVTPTVPVSRVPTPKVAIAKSGPARAKVLSKVRYTITVRNSGKATLRNVVLRDRLPSGLSFVGASRASTLASGNATFQIGTLAPGASRAVTVTLMANASVTGSRTNTATVSATGVRPVSARATTFFRPLVRRVLPAVTG